MEDYYSHRNSAHRFAIDAVDDSGPLQFINASGMDSEVFTRITRIQQHGFSSVSPVDSHMLAISMGGRRDQLFAVGGEHPTYRPLNLGAGNTALYNADGSIMKLIGKNFTVDAGGTMTVTVKEFVVKADKITLDGECHIGGAGGVPASMRGTTDTAGFAAVGGLASKVYLT